MKGVIARTAYLDAMTSKNESLSNNTKTQSNRFCYQSFVETIEHYYMQFLLVTTLYVMEPWERFLMMTIFLLVISLVTYSALVYIPYHVHNIIQSTVPIFTDVLLP